MITYQIYVAGKQRGSDYTDRKKAIQNGEAIARSNRRVHVYEVKDGTPASTVAFWNDGKRIK